MGCSIAVPTASPRPTRELSVRRNFGWTAAGNAIHAACQWGMVGVLAKMSSAEVVGQYALGVAVTAPIFMLAQLNLRSVLATDVANSHPFRDYRDLRLMSIGMALAATLGLALVAYSGTESRIVAVMGLLQVTDWCSDIYFGLLQRHERMDRIAVSLITRGLASVTVLALGMMVTHDLTVSLLALLPCRACVYLVYDSRIAVRGILAVAGSRSRPRWTNRALLLRTALPLGFVMMAGSLSGNIPRYFITHQLNTYALGIFAALASLTQAGNMVVNALGQAATPRLAKLFAARDFGLFRRLTTWLVLSGASLGVAGVFLSLTAGQRVLLFLFRPEYADHTALLAVLCGGAGLGFVASMLGYAITAARRFREQMPIQAVSVAASAATAFFLVPQLGLTGAALALAAAPAVQTLGELRVLRDALHAPAGKAAL